MELALFVYLAEVCGKLSQLWGLIILIIAGYVALRIAASPVDDDDEVFMRYVASTKGVVAWLATIAIITGVFIPSSKTMYTMVGAYAGQQVATSESTSEIMSKTLKIINKKLDEELK